MLLLQTDDGFSRIPEALCVLIIILFNRSVTTEVCNATGPGNCYNKSLCSWTYSKSVWNTNSPRFRLKNIQTEGTITSQRSCATNSTNCLLFELWFENGNSVTVTVTANANERNGPTNLWESDGLQSKWISSHGTVQISFCSYSDFIINITARRPKQGNASVFIRNIIFTKSKCQCTSSNETNVCQNQAAQCPTSADYKNSNQGSDKAYTVNTGAIVGVVVAVGLVLVGVIVVLILVKRKGLSFSKSCLQRQRQSEELPVTASHNEAYDSDHSTENGFQEADTLGLRITDLQTQSLTDSKLKTSGNVYNEINTATETSPIHDYCTIPNIYAHANKNVSIYEVPQNNYGSEPEAGRRTPDAGSQTVHDIPFHKSQETAGQAESHSSTGIYHILDQENHSTNDTEQSVHLTTSDDQDNVYNVLDSEPKTVGEESERSVYHLPTRQAEHLSIQNIPTNNMIAGDYEIKQVRDKNHRACHTSNTQNPTDAIVADSPRTQSNSTEDDYNRLGMHAMGKTVHEDTGAEEGADLYNHLADTDVDDYKQIDRDRHTKVIDEDYSHLH